MPYAFSEKVTFKENMAHKKGQSYLVALAFFVY